MHFNILNKTFALWLAISVCVCVCVCVCVSFSPSPLPYLQFSKTELLKECMQTDDALEMVRAV